MDKDPYKGIVGIMEEAGKKYNPPSIQLGQVTGINPLKIKIGDLILEKYNLLINENLLKYDRKVTLNTSCNGDVNGYHGKGSLANIGVNKATMNIETTLNINNTVALLQTQDIQTYIVLCKVV